MAKRPAARPSSLAGRSPVHPQNDSENALDLLPEPEPTSLPAEVAPALVEPVAEVKDDDKARKDGFYMKPSDKQRAERARMTTSIHTGVRSWTAYVNEAVMAYTKQLEKDYNDSKPF